MKQCVDPKLKGEYPPKSVAKVLCIHPMTENNSVFASLEVHCLVLFLISKLFCNVGNAASSGGSIVCAI